MFTNGTAPPNAVKESCAATTEPVEVLVVADANVAVPACPNRTSLPSMFPPESAGRAAFPAASKCHAISDPLIQKSAITAASTYPCLRLPTSLPNVPVNANGITKMRNIWKKFVSGLGFSNGCAELAL